MSREKKICVIGARHHGLKKINVDIPHNKLIVITGPSGSGKSTLAIDVLYAEGQRRYLESLPSYARQFLNIPEKPDVESIIGLCPSIAIDQKTISNNPRSTVGTITEIYEYLRVLFATIGIPHCIKCNQKLSATNPDILAQEIIALSHQKKNKIVTICAPLTQEKKGTFKTILMHYIKNGYIRFFINEEIKSLRNEEDIDALQFDKNKKYSISIVVFNSNNIADNDLSEISHAIQRCFDISKESCLIIWNETEKEIYTKDTFCSDCKIGFPVIDARLFSFNTPIGACSKCNGSGVGLNIKMFNSDESEENINALKFKWIEICTICKGSRINIHAQNVLIDNKNIFNVSSLVIKDTLQWIENIYNTLDIYQQEIIERLYKEIKNRLQFLVDVGLDYISLARGSNTISGGEGQRIRLATQIGSGLSGVMYILDEPSIGLHQRDNDKLINTLKKLRDLDNTVIVVEHDSDTMKEADIIIDMGPGSGRYGGEIVFIGTPEEIIKDKKSITGQYLNGTKTIISSKEKKQYRTPKGFITLKNAQYNNLKNITVNFPLGVLCCISGVSGSGKSSLVFGEFARNLEDSIIKRRQLNTNQKISGDKSIKNIIIIDQKPIGRTPRSNPVTYLGIFDGIRDLFSLLPESKARGYTQSTFSFNTGNGRCKECKGQGQKTISMHMLPDVSVNCRTCHGTGYTPQVLEIMYKEKNISDVLRMSVDEAVGFFEHHKSIYRKLKILQDVGMGYITLGQSALTFSGGEAQRIKLADELSKRGENTAYILDEPTTGLHFDDIKKLLLVFDTLIEKGNSIYVIEHNIDVLRYADYIIDIGPEGGENGGNIVCTGTPNEIKNYKKSITGKYI